MITAAVLKDSPLGFAFHDTVVIKVDLTVFRDSVDDLSLTTLAADKQTLSFQLLEYFESSEEFDVTLVVATDNSGNFERISAHKLILMARSPVFRAMLTHSMSESNTNEIVISDFSPEVIREMLHFMYTDHIKVVANSIEHVLTAIRAAVKYELTGLVQLLEGHCATKLLTDTSAANILLQADSCGAERLKATTLQYIKNRSYEILHHQEFNQFVEGCLQTGALRAALGQNASNETVLAKAKSPQPRHTSASTTFGTSSALGKRSRQRRNSSSSDSDTGECEEVRSAKCTVM